MDTYHMNPENMRAPDHLSREEVQKSLTELDSKIKTLRARVNATAADSNHTYHEHIAALEKKRELLSEKLDSSDETQNKWQDLRLGIDNLKNDLRKYFD